jgi:hypothetical protein
VEVKEVVAVESSLGDAEAEVEADAEVDDAEECGYGRMC